MEVEAGYNRTKGVRISIAFSSESEAEEQIKHP